ncbi:efflux RND transporter periplasmic adaptor subunit [Desulfosudis oleivorans]|uniref:Efflux transporter, RND family, MFP subunit n=1 Tax=Desulfosudis oleivorans (strain DSM 6200 / JCM 39069 / Hxd3) TaxID=96561 RepID=A8ZYH2_DESOH|nr:efflux RND transporter periplasmic adaptor subunit [Desulfosudis oleivorans]ABW68697.1 efflux transporter, RND family, MFP subunit [Desulfosudis oleivorans Hxd3]
MQRFGKNKIVPSALIVAVVLTGLVLVSGCRDNNPPPQRPAPEVGVVTIEEQPVALTTELPGRAAPFLMADIRPQVNGIIQKRLFEEGAMVKAGQVLYQIDPAQFEAVYAAAKAALDRSQSNLASVQARADRYRELLAAKAVSQQDVDDADAALSQVRADIEYWKSELEKAGINLNYTRVTAPISGRIGRSSVTAGAVVTAYQPVPLSTIVQLNPIYVDVTQSSSELLRLGRDLETGKITNGTDATKKVRILLEDGTPYPHEGTLQFRDVTVDPSTGSYVLRVKVPNPEQVLMPGMFVRAVVMEGTAPRAILAPQQGVARNTKGEPLALVVNSDNVIKQRILTVERAIGNQWLVLSGLSAGDRVVVEGQLNIRPDMTVKPIPADIPSSGETPAPAPSN